MRTSGRMLRETSDVHDTWYMRMGICTSTYPHEHVYMMPHMPHVITYHDVQGVMCMMPVHAACPCALTHPIRMVWWTWLRVLGCDVQWRSRGRARREGTAQCRSMHHTCTTDMSSLTRATTPKQYKHQHALRYMYMDKLTRE